MKGRQQAEIKVGVSSCLLGEKVRWDGNHKQDRYLTDYLGQYVEWVPVCPEYEAGMGVPRETVHLIGRANPRMLGTRTGTDWTARMNRFTKGKLSELEKMDLSGFILKKGSPSCGFQNVKLRTSKGMPAGTGSGLFAEALARQFPVMPVEDEGRLNDPAIRENFITRVFAFARLKKLFAEGCQRQDLVRFHTAHKFLLLAHSQKHYRQLGRIVADLKKSRFTDAKKKYRDIFMQAFTLKSSPRKNVNVLQHMHGFFKDKVCAADRKDILDTIQDYEKDLSRSSCRSP